MALRRWWAAAGIGAVVLLVASLPLGLNGDVQYVLGGLRATDGHETFVTTFVHRPIAYRALVAAIDAPAGVVGLGPDSLYVYEAAIRAMGLLLAGGTAVVTWGGLRRWIPSFEASVIAAAVGLSLALVPAWDFLQAEWAATAAVALAVGTALWPRSDAAAGALSGLFALLAVALKIATLAFAPLAFVLVLLLSRRRAVAMTIGGFAWLATWLALMVVVVPLEWQWVRDMGGLSSNSPFRSPLDERDLQLLATAVSSKLVLQPWLVALPAALVLLARTCEQPRRGAAFAFLGAAAILLACTPIALQGQYSLYHLAALPVTAAALVASAAIRWHRSTGGIPLVILLPLPVLGVGSAVVLALPPATRAAIDLQVTVGLALLGILLLMLAAVTRRAPPPRSAPSFGAAVVLASLAVFLPAVAPSSAWALNPGSTPHTNRSWPPRVQATHDSMAALRSEIGAETPVLYLSYGDLPYHLGNPTDCAYPSPLWVQRGMALPYVVEFESYADNVECLSSGLPRYMVLAPGWFAIEELQPPLRQLLDDTYDCGASVTHGGVVACPRR